MNPAPQTPTLLHQRASARGPSRGFTLIELMVVVVIIGIFASIALPSVVNQLRERKSANVAQQITQFYRTARMRAAGRGSAVLVRYDSTPGSGGVFMREAIAGAATQFGCALAPISSCTLPANRWDSPLLYSQLDWFNPFNTTAGTQYELTRLQFLDAGSGIQGRADVCFTPGGRTFIRYAFDSTAFNELNFVPTVRVWSQKDTAQIGPNRFVYLLPNGIARVGL